jgi:hypothetical protein
MTEKRAKPLPFWAQRPAGEPESTIPHRDLSQDLTARAEAEASWKRHYERTMASKVSRKAALRSDKTRAALIEG